jgi:hypothetical protein
MYCCSSGSSQSRPRGALFLKVCETVYVFMPMYITACPIYKNVYIFINAFPHVFM